MKRSPALSALSREHHTALVWAKRAQAVSDPQNLGALMAKLVTIFENELEPHFRVEETRLLAALLQCGERELVERTQAEHRALRAAIARIRAGDAEALAPFGAALAAHVRFEERELFPAAEARLSSEALAAIAEAAL
jgi:hypothetical protein